MAFIDDVDEASADPSLAEMFAVDRANWGFLPNFARTFGHRPRVYAAWRELNSAVKAGMDERRYELATLAAAATLRSSYCSLAHGRVLATKNLVPEHAVAAIADGVDTDLDDVDQAIVRLARRIADDATSVTVADIDELRGLGLRDDEILDVILAAAARCFFSTVLDGTGTLPDHVFTTLPDQLRHALTVGRPIDDRDAGPAGGATDA